MKPSVVMMVRDEADIIIKCLHRWVVVGVRDFFICDNGSVDGTLEKLKDFGKLPLINLRLSQDPATDWPGRRVINSLKDKAVDEGFNWIFPADADEFLQIPGFYNIQDWIKVTGADSGWGELPYLNILPSGIRYWQEPHKKAFGVIDKSMTICMGNHLIEGSTRSIDPIGAYYEHYSIRTFSQFRQKMLNYMVAFSKNGFSDHPHAENYGKWQERGEGFILDLWNEETSRKK